MFDTQVQDTNVPLDSAQIGFSARQSAAKKTLDEARAYPLGDVIARFQKDGGLSEEEACLQFDELLKYLVLCSQKTVGIYGMRGPIDNAWHSFLMFTRLYQQFCDDVLGQFVHHRPNTTDRHEVEPASGYQDFIQDYEIAFGHVPATTYWPRSETMDCDDCETCGHDCKTS